MKSLVRGKGARSFGPAALGVLLLAGAAVAPGAQSESRDSKRPITLSGCVSRDATGRVTFTDADGTTYRLTGRSVREYVGRHVQIVGGPDSKRVKVKGGLFPSPNVAGQAGAMDPSRAAIAGGAGGTASGTGDVELPDFRVNRVRATAGECASDGGVR